METLCKKNNFLSDVTAKEFKIDSVIKHSQIEFVNKNKLIAANALQYKNRLTTSLSKNSS